MLDNYKTMIDQESFNSVGLISTIVGFFLLSYFFMYFSLYLDIRMLTKLRKDLFRYK